MSDIESGWQKVLSQITDPWDWAAAAAGAAAGACGTIVLHGADLGHSVPGGALGAIAARKTMVASFARGKLRQKAEGLIGIVDARIQAGGTPVAVQSEYVLIRKSLELELELWKNDRTSASNDSFAKKVGELENRIRKNAAQAAVPQALAAPPLNQSPP